ncbi:MAG TPA: RNA methyltransferase [Candidatus Pullichristensenella avicola]|nr:RNA methyltransferase [Candidatus Pullichristensenella avicola]
MEIITSVKNPLAAELRALKSAKARRETGLFLVEGETMLKEALSSGLVPRALLAQTETPLAARFPQARLVTRGVLEAVCDTKTPQGMCAAFEMPAPRALQNAPRTLVALDGVQDPGNVGTIWRTADAAGLGGLLLGAGCADPYSPKVQRAAMGSGFRLPAIPADPLCEALAALRGRGWTVVASALDGADFYARKATGERFVLVIGSEAHGISDAVRAQADALVKLPMRGRAESLNAAVAAGIMMYEMTR